MEFREARDFLLQKRIDYAAARQGFRWPDPAHFNWALDWFDGELARSPDSRDRCALWIVEPNAHSETKLTFAALSSRSNQVANYMRELGLARGDHILVLLGNVPAMWEVTLAAMKLGLVVIPATTLLTAEELADRFQRGRAKAVVAYVEQLSKCPTGSSVIQIAVDGAGAHGQHSYGEAFACSETFRADGPTAADDPMLLYFTSGTTAKPKLVRHSHRSYPIGALSTMYWLGLQPGDVHLNVSSPGWAKHAWSSLFAPWNAGATVFVVNQAPFSAKTLLAEIVRCNVTTLCAPPTVWRLIVQEDLAASKVGLREVAGAGEPLNPEIIEKIREAWGLTVRDGYGQTETTAQVGNSPGQTVKTGAMGRPLPGYHVQILDADGEPATEGEVCLVLGDERPAGLMQGYQNDKGELEGADGRVYRTGDVAFIDDDGYITFGRADDVFKSSDYRISPFELESVLIEHPAVVETAVIPAPDAIRLAVPKAYVILTASAAGDRETAVSILRYVNDRLSPFKRVRRIEFVKELPKTISGKIRRVQLRRLEHEGVVDDPYRGVEFIESDLPELAGVRRPPPAADAHQQSH